MKNIFILLMSSLIMISGCGGKTVTQTKSSSPCTPVPVKVLPEDLKKLGETYPSHFTVQYPNHILWNDGELMPYDIKTIEKDFYTRVNCPDLADHMSIPYTTGVDYPVPLKNHDPGRIRYEPFLKKMYGSTKEEVRKQLKPIIWLPSTVNRTLYITSVNNINKKLQAVSNELDKLPDHIKKYVIRSSGTFNWRTILQTSRLSPHSFGIAIDIDASRSHYWKWDYKGANFNDPDLEIVYRNTIPLEIVEIFEKHGFIWGGKWYHYDTMHFEYQPEIMY